MQKLFSLLLLTLSISLCQAQNRQQKVPVFKREIDGGISMIVLGAAAVPGGTFMLLNANSTIKVINSYPSGLPRDYSTAKALRAGGWAVIGTGVAMMGIGSWLVYKGVTARKLSKAKTAFSFTPINDSALLLRYQNPAFTNKAVSFTITF